MLLYLINNIALVPDFLCDFCDINAWEKVTAEVIIDCLKL